MEARERAISGEPLGLVGGESDALEHAALRGAHAQTHVELLRHLRVFVELGVELGAELGAVLGFVLGVDMYRGNRGACAWAKLGGRRVPVDRPAPCRCSSFRRG